MASTPDDPARRIECAAARLPGIPTPALLDEAAVLLADLHAATSGRGAPLAISLSAEIGWCLWLAGQHTGRGVAGTARADRGTEAHA
ncbi:hypothetical protein [Amycolatopsis sp. H20-H5]|uniref:hypothetical protein n=1 Tax=Amycolatopsis sp. H20-H5 TaxID=3046309 RepID=UPI002DBCC894|nr:hypothetical protein [Amycolatopsis sp. H20-H5]MEC3980493.1 hypothetical protein [Amycolatopsis sp. H20-H5]